MGILDIFDEGKQVKDTQEQLRNFIIDASNQIPELKPYADKIAQKVQSLHGDQLLMFLDDMVKNTPSLKPYANKIISKFAGAGGITESNIQPETAVAGGLVGGASAGGVIGAIKGAASALATEPIWGEAYTAYENVVRKKLPDWLKVPADVAVNFLIGHLVGKLGQKGEEITQKVVSKIPKEKPISIDDVHNILKEVEQEATKTGDKETAKAIQQAKQEITPEQWQRVVRDITQKVREKQPPKQSIEDVVDDVSDIRPPEPTPKEKITKQIKDVMRKQTEDVPNSPGVYKPTYTVKSSQEEGNIVFKQIKDLTSRIKRTTKTPVVRLSAEYEIEGKPVTLHIYRSKRISTIELEGNTLPIKEKLKELGFKWDGNRWVKETTFEDIGKALENVEKIGFKNLKQVVEKVTDDAQSGITYSTLNRVQDNIKQFTKKHPEIKLYSGINPLKAFDAFHSIIRSLDEKYGDNKVLYAIRQFARKYLGADKYGLPFLSEERENQLIDSLYGKARPIYASNIEKGKTYVDAIKNWIGHKNITDGFVIEYLESPEFRQKVRIASQKNPILKEIADKLDVVNKHIDDLSEEYYQRGFIGKKQRDKWQGRYLSRIYDIDEKAGIDSLARFRQAEIKSGRKIENIMALPEEERRKLGYVEDAPLAVLDTISKAAKNIALDEWYRDIIKMPELVHQDFVVKIPEEIRKIKPKLPEYASPYWVKNRLIKNLHQEGISNELLRKLAKEAREKIKAIEQNEEALKKAGWASLGDKQKLRYGILSGLPVKDKFAGWLKGFTSITDDPEGVFNALDKAMTTWISLFKTAKVPLNVQALPRNWVSNIFQWYYSGANRPLSYFMRALKEIKTNGKFYQLAKENGLFHTNFTDEEIMRVLNELHSKSKNKFIKAITSIYKAKTIDSMIKLYSAVDDVWKLARMIYALEREKKGITQAIRTAQDAHFDYSLVGNIIRAMRDPNIKHGTALKLIAPLFPTYMQKSWAYLIESLTKRPFQTSLVLAAPILLAHKIKQILEEKYGKDTVEKAYKYMPEYLPKDTTIVWSKDGKNWFYIPITYILPHGWLVETAEDLASGDLTEAGKDIGAMGLPIYTLVDIMKNQDRLGRPIYKDYDATLAKMGDWKAKGEVAKDVLGYIWQQTLEPGTLTNLRHLRETKHPVLPRLAGQPVYEYNISELERWKALELKQKINEIKKDMVRIQGQYKKGQITKEERNKALKELKQKIRELVEGYKNELR
jgi:hypothetical protein